MIATLTSKGQLTLPKPVRDVLSLQAGDRLDFIIRDDGTLEVVPLKQPATKLRGLLPKPNKAVSIEEMNAAIAKGATDE
jgi:AbrB family looped-hinge helix DNA binding protein